MTDCLSCRHAVPARAPDGRINFSMKICIRMPPTPVVVPAAPGSVSIQPMFPVVGKGVFCGEHDPRLIGEEKEEKPEGQATQ